MNGSMSRMTVDQAFVLGFKQQRAGNIKAAEALYRQILDVQPQHQQALVWLAKLSFDFGSKDEAAELMRRAIAVNPAAAIYHTTLGMFLSGNGKFDESIAAYRQAIALNSQTPEVYKNLAIALKEVGQLDEAIEAYRQSLALRPEALTASNLLYALHAHPDYDAKRLYEEHVRWNDTYAQTLAPADAKFDNDRAPGRRLRIGYVSADFRS